MAPELDFASYDPNTHPLFLNNPDRRDYLLYYQKMNAKVAGKFKDELKPNERIVEVLFAPLFVCLFVYHKQEMQFL